MKKLEAPPTPTLLLDTISRLAGSPLLVVHLIGNTELVRSINQDYPYWDKVKYKVPKNPQAILSPEELRVNQKERQFTLATPS